MLHITDKWVWDFWLAIRGTDYHVFYLQAPRSLGDPELRHWNASIGHAVSRDLRQWETLPDALQPSTAWEAWDSYTTWTGSVIRHAGQWCMFYTGTCRDEGGRIQRVGLATSDDLIHWRKHPENPLIEANPRWYELLDLNAWYEQAWRDPCVVRFPGEDRFHAFITARAHDGPEDGRGVIAHATSQDLIHWEVLPPVSEPGEYGHLEVPQWVPMHGRYYLLFCVTRDRFSQPRTADVDRPQLAGTYALSAGQPAGPFLPATQRVLLADETGATYAGKFVPRGDSRWSFLYSRLLNPAGEFLGEIADPLDVSFDADGNPVLIHP